MSAIDQTAGEVRAADEVDAGPESALVRFEALLGRLSERLNPILVKEARQALRSKQFIITFLLMLAAGWAWTIFALANIGPAVYYSAVGPFMFSGYFTVLAFPLLVVAPYSVFYSLSCERQDRTYELLSITALSPRQILSGKLGSVALQMIVYLSAIFPCLAFTYLLRGLDIFTIFCVVLYTCFLSLGLSVLGLLLAALTPLRQRQIVMTVLLLMVLFGAFFFDCAISFEVISSSSIAFTQPDFWTAASALATIYLNLCVLAFLAARSLLMCDSQNRSTALRVALVVAQLCVVGWASWGYLVNTREVPYAALMFLTFSWYVAGSLLTSEPPLLSPRVKRDLPQTTLGRVFLSWFTPGPGTGYMFVLSNMAAAAVTLLIPVFLHGWLKLPGFGTVRAINPAEFAQVSVIAVSYLAAYLGLGKLIVVSLRRYSEIRLLTRALIFVLLVAVGAGVPWSVQMTFRSLRDNNYTLLQVTNPLWTMSELCSRGLPFYLPVLILVVPAAAIVVWMLNVPSLIEELKQTRIAKPPRVADDDAEHAVKVPVGPASPWD